MTSLSELGKKKPVAAQPADDGGLDFGPSVAPAREVAAPRAIEPIPSGQEHPQIEVEAVIGGCLMRLHITDMSPAQVLPYLKGIDPGCKVRDDFPKGGAGFGKKETKRARLNSIRLSVFASGKSFELTCMAEKAMSVKVSKKNVDGFIAALTATGKVYAHNLDELQAGFEAKGTTVILKDEEAVDVEYWSAEDGTSFMEALHPGAAAA